jgi:hypothetical protein
MKEKGEPLRGEEPEGEQKKRVMGVLLNTHI